MATPSPQELYIQSYAQSIDPMFSSHTLTNHVLQAGRSQKKFICYFLPDRCLNLQESKHSFGSFYERYNGAALSTMMYFGYHFNRNDNTTKITENFCKGQDMSTSTDSDISEMVKNAWIINPEDKDTSSHMFLIVVFPTHIFLDTEDD